MKSCLIGLLGCLTLATAANNKTQITMEELHRVINKAELNSWGEMKDNEWNFPTYLGSWFLSEYYFELKALDLLEKS